MKDKRISGYFERLFLCLALSLLFLFSGCSSKSGKDTGKSPDYADKIDIEITMQSSSNLKDHHQNHIIYTITNNGDKTITELSGDVAFYNRDGSEIGKMPWMFFFVDKEWEGKVDESQAGAFRSLPPGETMNADFNYLGFFVGREELRDKLKSDWDNITPKIIIKKVIVE